MKLTKNLQIQPRRDFLKKLGLLGTGLLLPWYGNSSVLSSDVPLKISPVRIRGKVSANGKGLKGVAVTDGYTVTSTDAGGIYELHSTNAQEFVYISVPSGHSIPVQSNSIASFYQPIKPTSKGEFNASFNLTPSPVNDSNHVMLLLADPQIQNRYEADLLLNETTPDVAALVKSYSNSQVFGIGCGDLVFDEFELFADYQKAVQGMGIPFFQALGNHDMDTKGIRSDTLSASTFKKLFGPTYYSFNRGEVHYVVLEDVFFIGSQKQYIGYLTEEQLRWLEQDLALVEKGKTVVVSLHIPAFTNADKRNNTSPSLGGTVSNRAELYRLLEPYKAHIMSGHTHFNEKIKQGNIMEHVHGTVCGAWWSGPICYDGTPNGYGVYEVKGSELQWYYKSTGKDKKHQFRHYLPGTNPGKPDEMAVNVWNADDAWKIVWLEDGIRKGAMRQETGLDPLSVELHTGDKKPERRPWVEPQLTDHLFFAPLSPQARQVTIEVTDRFGNVYAETFDNKKA
jgi:hypothetical protein